MNKIRIIPIIRDILDFLNCSYQIYDNAGRYIFILMDADSDVDYTKFYVAKNVTCSDLFIIHLTYYTIPISKTIFGKMIDMLLKIFNPHLEADDVFVNYFHAKKGIEKIIDEISTYTPEEFELYLKLL